MKKENLSLEQRFGKNGFLLFWMMAHIFLWGITQAISSTAKLSLHLLVAQILNPFICSLEISENSWGNTCTIIGIDFGLAVGQLVSFLIAFIFGGIIAGLGEWRLIKKSFNIPTEQRTPIIIISIVVGLFIAFFVNFSAMFSGIINIVVGGVNPSFATFIMGFFFGGLFGIFYGIVTLIIYYLSRNKKLVNEKQA